VTAYLAALICAKLFVLDPDRQNRVLGHVGKYVQLDREALRQELFMPMPGIGHASTELSPNNGTDVVRDYAERMREAGLISEQAVGAITEQTRPELLVEAYRRVFPDVTLEEAKAFASRGLAMDDRALRVRPRVPVRPAPGGRP
jgi:hypothetical protein